MSINSHINLMWKLSVPPKKRFRQMSPWLNIHWENNKIQKITHQFQNKIITFLNERLFWWYWWRFVWWDKCWINTGKDWWCQWRNDGWYGTCNDCWIIWNHSFQGVQFLLYQYNLTFWLQHLHFEQNIWHGLITDKHPKMKYNGC